MGITTKKKRFARNVSQDPVLRSLRRSRVRTEIVMYLYKIYPEASYPAEISKNAGIEVERDGKRTTSFLSAVNRGWRAWIWL